MQIKDILLEKGSEVVTIGIDRTIHDAIVRLNDHKIGALIVKGENEEVAGIITERDILQQCGERCARHIQDAPPAKEEVRCPSLVREAMTTELVIGLPDDDLNYVMGVMTKNRIRHLPIMDDGKLAGMISIGDLINAHFEEKVFENRTLRDYIHGSAR
jgi:CBS domain-containing protein